jgi:hypothetical protein
MVGPWLTRIGPWLSGIGWALAIVWFIHYGFEFPRQWPHMGLLLIPIALIFSGDAISPKRKPKVAPLG